MIKRYWALLLLSFAKTSLGHFTFQLNDIARQLTGKEIVCSREGQVVSLLEATNGTFQSTCFECVCRNQTLTCLRKLCPSISSNCPLVQPSQRDECCDECVYCVDEHNQRRENGEVWPSQHNKCARVVCETGIRTVSRMECINSCSAEVGIHSQAYCCRLCPIQTREQMAISTDPCVRCETIGGFWQQCFRLACPVLNCAPDQQRRSTRHCCPRCAKRRESALVTLPQAGAFCSFRHLTYVWGQRFRPDACSQCECTVVGLECKRYVCPVECPGGHYRPQVCCPFCGHFRNQTLPQLGIYSQCVIQLNATQMIWKDNDEWSPDVCTSCVCTRGRVSCQSRLCPELRCDEAKQHQVTPLGQCCPVCLDGHQKGDTGLCKLSTEWHLRTFDGTDLQIQQPCVFILVQQCLFGSQPPAFTLKVHSSPDGHPHKLSIELNEQNGAYLGTMNVLKSRELKFRGRYIKLPQRTRFFHATREKHRLTLDFHSLGIKLVWLEDKVVRIFADKKHFGSLCGLCGNFNGIKRDDLLPRFAMNITVNPQSFIKSWRSDDEECQEPGETTTDAFDEIGADKSSDKKAQTKINADECSHLLSKARKAERRQYNRNCSKLKKSPVLSACNAQLPVQQYIRRCAVDVCECEKQQRRQKLKRVAAAATATTEQSHSCHCRGMNDYVDACAKRGLLTLGGSLNPLSGAFRIHPKCPEIRLDKTLR